MSYKSVPRDVRLEFLHKYSDRLVLAVGACLVSLLIMFWTEHSAAGAILWLVSIVPVLTSINNAVPFLVSILYDDGLFSHAGRPSLQVKDVMKWKPPERPWREHTGIRYVEQLKKELIATEKRLTEVAALQCQVTSRTECFRGITRWMINRVYGRVYQRCTGDYDVACDLVRRIESILAGDVNAEIRDRQDELWRATRERSKAPSYLWEQLDESIRNIEHAIAELKERGEKRSIAEKDANQFEYYRFTRHIDALSEVYENFEHHAIREMELFKAVERICSEIQRDRYLTPAEKSRQMEAVRQHYKRSTTSAKADARYGS